MITLQLGFIGVGNMANALISGLLAHGYPPEKISLSNPRTNAYFDEYKQKNLHVSHDNNEIAGRADLLILAVKPKVIPDAVRSMAEVIQQKRPCVLSVATGIRLESFEKWLGKDIAIIRSMPNTPALVGYGMTGLYGNASVSSEQKEAATRIMNSVGKTIWVNQENQLETVTALSGSGPAYFFLMMEALEAGAIELGLPADMIHELTLQTALGAAHLAAEKSEALAELRKKITSPGGTTEQAIHIFEQGHLRELVLAAMTAAQQRAIELGKIYE